MRGVIIVKWAVINAELKNNARKLVSENKTKIDMHYSINPQFYVYTLNAPLSPRVSPVATPCFGSAVMASQITSAAQVNC